MALISVCLKLFEINTAMCSADASYNVQLELYLLLGKCILLYGLIVQFCEQNSSYIVD